jgi:hypothetical protein
MKSVYVINACLEVILMFAVPVFISHYNIGRKLIDKCTRIVVAVFAYNTIVFILFAILITIKFIYDSCS